jgi:hypothetical protein
LEKNPDKIIFSHALLSEYITVLALEPLLKPYSYQIDLAPQSLEHGVGQKGVDLLILNQEHKIMLGIDVKLETSKYRFNRNGGRWLNHLKSPYINLTLGNWLVKGKDPQVNNIKNWLTYSVLSNIPETGKIPQLNDFRSFVVTRIKNSLQFQQENCQNHNFPPDILPLARQDYLVYKQKLKGLIAIFSSLEDKLN